MNADHSRRTFLLGGLATGASAARRKTFCTFRRSPRRHGSRLP